MGVKVIGESGIGYPVRDNSAREIKQGEKRWNLKEGSIETGVFDSVNIVDGSDTFKLLRNNTGASIPKGKVLMASGTLGASGRILGSLSDGSVANAIRNVGITKHNVTNTNDVVTITNGKIDKLDTTGSSVGEGWLDGTILYISPNGSGNLTSIVPTTGQLKMAVAFVIKAHATNGSIEVRMTGIDENHIRNGLMTGDVVLGTSDSGTVDIKSGGVSRLLLDNYGVKNQGEYLSPFSGFKNLIVNGDFNVWQKTISSNLAVSGSGVHFADRWKVHCQVNTSNFSVSKANSPSQAGGFALSLTKNASTAYFFAVQTIPSNPFLSGKTITISCKVYSVGFTKVSFGITYDTIKDSTTVTTTPSVANHQTLDVTNNNYTVLKRTITLPTYTDNNFTLALNIAIGDNITTEQGSIFIRDVQMELGSVATPFERRPYDLELALCGEPNDNSVYGYTPFNQAYQKGFKNYLINGDMKVWQRGKSTFTIGAGTTAYTADRWLGVAYGNCSGTVAYLNGARTYLSLSCGSYISGYLDASNKIEGTTQFKAGKYYTLSFVYSSNVQAGLILQDFNGSSYNVWLSTTIPVSASEVKYTITFLAKNSATDFASSVLNVIFRLQTVGVINISEVQIEEGSVATAFEQRPYGLELSLCKRYYEIFNYPSGTAIAVGNTVSNGVNVNYNLPITPKRTTPSVGSSGSFSFRQGGSDNNVTALGILQYNTENSSVQLYTSHTSVTNGYAGSLFAGNTCTIAFSAELP